MNHTDYLSLQGLSKSYGKVTALSDFNLSVAQGEFISLLGPSGCGKTTTLQLLAGFVQPSAGDILLNGKSMTNEEIDLAISKVMGTDKLRKWSNDEDGNAVDRGGHYESCIPGYSRDLNAMHEVTSKLPNRDDFVDELYNLIARRDKITMMDAAYLAVDATARQRSEAFLRTIGMWKD